ncbi:hypothetical protein [Akkermansia glycaniphila]|uniref:Sulfatase-modifying factor enzyme domain-containing protein n=1 Tax=Akkermansia glycaniphila TaxID=1679444 RepID=A0A1H6M1U8_9BACT|nr:hypothetical protein [Akkermansia glycaniphila]SEH91210.1 Hypothetical protein PYTT_1653 [Akkermansia glycaniphila]
MVRTVAAVLLLWMVPGSGGAAVQSGGGVSIRGGSSGSVEVSGEKEVPAPAQGGRLAPPNAPVKFAAGGRKGEEMRYADPKTTKFPAKVGVYPWHFDVTATVFWIGEAPTARNKTPNHKSSWDQLWQANYGGFDHPDTEFRTEDFCPKGFVPRLNPFYVALPYNDCVGSSAHKPEAERVIPWFKRDFERAGRSVCKGVWVQIFYEGRYCFAQWEDCGPFTTDDWEYVFGSKPPKNANNNAAGIDISPAVRDFLGIPSGSARVHWRFVDFHLVKEGPWAKYGLNNPFVNKELKHARLKDARRGKGGRVAPKAVPAPMDRKDWSPYRVR